MECCVMFDGKGEEMEPTKPVETITSEADVQHPDIFELVYQGPNVDDGTMSARELIEVLNGLTRSFSTVAQELEVKDRYELRIRDIESNSVHLIFEAVAFAKANPAAATAIAAGATVIVSATTNTVSGAYKIITDIARTIDAKKRVKGDRIATLPTSFSDGEVTLKLPDDLIVLTKEQYELLLSQKIDKQLSLIVSPLSPDRINSFQMRRSNEELVKVEAKQRDYFDYVEVKEEKSKEGKEIVGTLNSLTKTNLRGTFYTAEGVHVPYKYVGGNIAELMRAFSSREALKVHGRIKYGTDGIPKFVEVQAIEFLQGGFFDQ